MEHSIGLELTSYTPITVLSLQGDSTLTQPMFIERFQYTAVAVPAMSGWTNSITTDAPRSNGLLDAFAGHNDASEMTEGKAEAHKGAERIAYSQMRVDKEPEPTKVTDRINTCVLKVFCFAIRNVEVDLC